jgi:hypothetical protein
MGVSNRMPTNRKTRASANTPCTQPRVVTTRSRKAAAQAVATKRKDSSNDSQAPRKKPRVTTEETEYINKSVVVDLTLGRTRSDRTPVEVSEEDLGRRRDEEYALMIESEKKLRSKEIAREKENQISQDKASYLITPTSSPTGENQAMSDNAPQASKDDAKSRRRGPPERRNVDQIVFGDMTFKAECASEYPSEIISTRTDTIPVLHVCENCFAYTIDLGISLRHKNFCSKKPVPGDTIYNHQGKGVWKVNKLDGASKDHKVLSSLNISVYWPLTSL